MLFLLTPGSHVRVHNGGSNVPLNCSLGGIERGGGVEQLSRFHRLRDHLGPSGLPNLWIIVFQQLDHSDLLGGREESRVSHISGLQG